jgi:hypothetical protein
MLMASARLAVLPWLWPDMRLLDSLGQHLALLPQILSLDTTRPLALAKLHAHLLFKPSAVELMVLGSARAVAGKPERASAGSERA